MSSALAGGFFTTSATAYVSIYAQTFFQEMLYGDIVYKHLLKQYPSKWLVSIDSTKRKHDDYHIIGW